MQTCTKTVLLLVVVFVLLVFFLSAFFSLPPFWFCVCVCVRACVCVFWFGCLFVYCICSTQLSLVSIQAMQHGWGIQWSCLLVARVLGTWRGSYLKKTRNCKISSFKQIFWQMHHRRKCLHTDQSTAKPESSHLGKLQHVMVFTLTENFERKL